MLKMTALLCAAIFLAMLVAGEDRGQMRPGLEQAGLQDSTPEATPAATIRQTAQPASLTADLGLPVVLPVMQPAEPAAPQATQTATDAEAEALAGIVSASTPKVAMDVWYVDSASVNVRSGPGTENDVVGRLRRGEAVSVVWLEDNGWARILIEGDGVEGFVSTEFLSNTAP